MHICISDQAQKRSSILKILCVYQVVSIAAGETASHSENLFFYLLKGPKSKNYW